MAAVGNITTLWYPKNTDAPHSYEDASAFDRATSIFAVADGVSSAIFSRQWANVLVEETASNWVPLEDSQAVSGWIRPLRRKWSADLPENMEWFQREKLAQTGGAYATLLGVQLDFENAILKSFSFGDCCCFLFRDGAVVKTFPASDSEYFGITPYSLPSSRQPKEVFEPEVMECGFQVGDKLLLATDAIACWIFTKFEGGEQVDLQMFEQFDDVQWTEFVENLRSSHSIRVDDVTIQLAEITESSSETTRVIGPVPFENTTEPLVIEPISDDVEAGEHSEPHESQDESAPVSDDDVSDEQPLEEAHGDEQAVSEAGFEDPAGLTADEATADEVKAEEPVELSKTETGQPADVVELTRVGPAADESKTGPSSTADPVAPPVIPPEVDPLGIQVEKPSAGAGVTARKKNWPMWSVVGVILIGVITAICVSFF